jgi:hypothetical protein
MLRFASALRRVAPAALVRQPPARGLAFGDVPVPGDARVKHVTVLPGHGIGPELMRAAMAVLKATGAPLAFEVRRRAAAAASLRAPASPAVSRPSACFPAFRAGVRGGLGFSAATLHPRGCALLFYIFSSAAARAGD